MNKIKLILAASILLLSGQVGAAINSGDILATRPGLIKIDPVTGAQETISSGGLFDAALGIAVDANGDIIISDFGDVDVIFRVEPITGAQTAISTGGLFDTLRGIAVEADGKILALNQDGPNPGVIRVDPITGVQSILSIGGNFGDPWGIAIYDTGQILVVDLNGPISAGGIIKVDPITGTQIS